MGRGRIALAHLAFAALLAAGVASPTRAAADHTGYVKGPIADGPSATKVCLACHEEAAKQVMQTTHWRWSSVQDVEGRGSVDRGKKNAINNFCVSVNANWPRCTSCHVGYGWKDGSFDFSDASRVDCLVCHDTTGTYKKNPMGAGAPVDGIDLVFVAQHVGKPGRDNCGACHFFGGGGDAVKHGDLDSSMAQPAKGLDVHMAAAGQDFTCQSCHETKEHQLKGSAMVVSPANQGHIGCTNCHDERPHGESLLDDHLARVACQTCHIPTFAREVPTKTSWDWSTAGEDRVIEKDQYGKPTYDKKKGSFTWGKDIVPTYAWYKGKAGAYLVGDPMNPDGPTKLSYPLGNREDPEARIYPFKVHTGKQIYDTTYRYLITPKVFGEKGYWKTFDWDVAAREGMVASGLPYSGNYGFAETVMYWPINHMVVPAKQALGCLDCHGDKGRMDWTALGYQRDPLRIRTANR